VRRVRWSLPEARCDRCQHPAQRVWDVDRAALDLDLDHPVLLLVTVSVHRCHGCGRFFRAQPPFLRPDATSTNRVVAAAVASVFDDGMAITRVAGRLARDFWVRPSEAVIRLWCRAYATGLDFIGSYQPWVVEEFSGVLCVDEVYQDRLSGASGKSMPPTGGGQGQRGGRHDGTGDDTPDEGVAVSIPNVAS
jgi:hypothetical protein